MDLWVSPDQQDRNRKRQQHHLPTTHNSTVAVSVPAELATAQEYSPASLNLTSGNSNKVEFDNTVILHLSEEVSVTDPLRHVTDGVGKPLKIELKVTECPSETV